jgi:hypothetical protein
MLRFLASSLVLFALFGPAESAIALAGAGVSFVGSSQKFDAAGLAMGTARPVIVDSLAPYSLPDIATTLSPFEVNSQTSNPAAGRLALTISIAGRIPFRVFLATLEAEQTLPQATRTNCTLPPSLGGNVLALLRVSSDGSQIDLSIGAAGDPVFPVRVTDCKSCEVFSVTRQTFPVWVAGPGFLDPNSTEPTAVLQSSPFAPTSWTGTVSSNPATGTVSVPGFASFHDGKLEEVVASPVTDSLTAGGRFTVGPGGEFTLQHTGKDFTKFSLGTSVYDGLARTLKIALSPPTTSPVARVTPADFQQGSAPANSFYFDLSQQLFANTTDARLEHLWVGRVADGTDRSAVTMFEKVGRRSAIDVQRGHPSKRIVGAMTHHGRYYVDSANTNTNTAKSSFHYFLDGFRSAMQLLRVDYDVTGNTGTAVLRYVDNDPKTPHGSCGENGAAGGSANCVEFVLDQQDDAPSPQIVGTWEGKSNRLTRHVFAFTSFGEPWGECLLDGQRYSFSTRGTDLNIFRQDYASDDPVQLARFGKTDDHDGIVLWIRFSTGARRHERPDEDTCDAETCTSYVMCPPGTDDCGAESSSASTNNTLRSLDLLRVSAAATVLAWALALPRS